MSKFIEISPQELEGNVFQRIGRQWMLVTAGTREKFNTMTASWGGLGVLWNAEVSMIFVRPERYTYEFLERETDYSPVSYTHLNTGYSAVTPPQNRYDAPCCKPSKTSMTIRAEAVSYTHLDVYKRQPFMHGSRKAALPGRNTPGWQNAAI